METTPREAEPFIEKAHREAEEYSTSWWSRWRPLVLFHVVVFLIYGFTVVLVLRFIHKSDAQDRFQLPGPRLPLSQTVFHNISSHRTSYAGAAPNATIDEAWKRLLQPMNIAVSPEELAFTQRPESVGLPARGDKQLAWLGVYHELHCIKMLREWIYKEHYHAGKAKSEMKHLERHADHCLDILRQASMCRADRSLTTFRWDAKAARPMFDTTASLHMCTSWSALEEQMTARVVEDDEILALSNPVLSDDTQLAFS